MPGTYPRTEQQMLNSVMRNMNRLVSGSAVEHERLNSMGESRSNWRNEPTREEMRAGEVVYTPVKNSREKVSIPKEATEKEIESRVVNVPGVGEIDLKDIDNVKIHEVRNSSSPEYTKNNAGLESGKGTSSVYDVIAKIEISNPENNLPNFEQFSKLPSKRGMSEGELAMGYLQFRTNVANKLEAESRIGLGLDMSSLSDPTGIIGGIDGKFVRQIESLMAKGLHSPQYNQGICFVNPRDVGRPSGEGGINPKTGQESQNVEYFRKAFGEGSGKTFGLYRFGSSSNAIGINAQEVSPEDVILVSLHEWIHADNTHKRGFLQGREFGEGYEGIPGVRKQAVACEESLTNVRAYILADNPRAYKDFILENMYHLSPSPEGVANFIENTNKNNLHERAAEGLTFLKFTESNLFNKVVPDLLRKEEMGAYIKDRIIEYSSVCRPFTTNAGKANPSNPELFKSYEEYTRSKLNISPGDYGPHSDGDEKTFKCSALSLEEMVL